jgi:hypothetical protein
MNKEERGDMIDPEEDKRIHSEIIFHDGGVGLVELTHVAEEQCLIHSTNKATSQYKLLPHRSVLLMDLSCYSKNYHLRENI